MTEHTIDKPILFISHATTDGEFANVVKQEIEKVFADGLQVFCTSSPGSIPVGQDWLQDIESKLKRASATIVIVTPVSIERPWLWFELGATWDRGREGECNIYPLCAPEVELGALPSPLDRLQALSMGKTQDLKMLFQALIDQFGFGRISTLKPANISKRIPKYETVEVVDVDRSERVLYSGRYQGYSDDDLVEVISAEYFDPVSGKRYFHQPSIDRGRLIHFQDVDRDLDLPPGTARRLLDKVAEDHGLQSDYRTEYLVRYKRSPYE